MQCAQVWLPLPHGVAILSCARAGRLYLTFLVCVARSAILIISSCTLALSMVRCPACFVIATLSLKAYKPREFVATLSVDKGAFVIACLAMHLVTEEGDVIPCNFDSGRDLFVVRYSDCPDIEDECLALVIMDGKEYPINSFVLEEVTRRVQFISIDVDEEYLDSDTESDASDTESEGLFDDLDDSDLDDSDSLSSSSGDEVHLDSLDDTSAAYALAGSTEDPMSISRALGFQ